MTTTTASITEAVLSNYDLVLIDNLVRAYQARGSGRTLVELCKEASGPGAALILVAAPDAESYYPRLGLERIPAAFRLPRRPV